MELSDAYDGCEVDAPASWAEKPHQHSVQEDDMESLRRKVKYYFMNPCEKYHARGRKPWKLTLQIVKIAIITIQLVYFGLRNQMVVQFREENLITFRHLFLKDFSQADNYAVYTQNDVYDHIDYIIKQHGLLYNITVGNHEYEINGTSFTPLLLCQEYYRSGTIFPANETLEIDSHVQKDCLKFYPTKPLSLSDVEPPFEVYFKRLISITVTFVLKAINLQTVRYRELPDCYDFTVVITFDNQVHSGQIKIVLEDHVEINECRDWNVTGVAARNIYLTMAFDLLIIVTCVASFTLCTRSVVTGLRLQLKYSQHCSKHFNKEVPLSDRLEFVSGWYILIIVSDLMTTIGSILKIEIQTKVQASYEGCSIFLGIGTMFVWIGVIRYMGYFRKYNILILTLRAAFPNVIRFICCAGIIYLSYCLCGWIVLGPYHGKFRTLNTVSECLFSLLNGDDIFSTFVNINQKSTVVWVFSRVYLYSFVSLFTYLVLSLFITIITDTYDTIKQQQQSGTPISDLQKFLSECKDLPNSGAYRLNQRDDCFLDLCFNRCRQNHERMT